MFGDNEIYCGLIVVEYCCDWDNVVYECLMREDVNSCVDLKNDINLEIYGWNEFCCQGWY